MTLIIKEPFKVNRFSIICVIGIYLTSVAFVACKCESKKLKPTNLKCQSIENPIGIDVEQPVFSWIVESQAKGQKQTAYQIIVADTNAEIELNKGNMWDSGKILSRQTTNIVYHGKPLQSNQKYYWKKKSWDVLDNSCGFSEVASFVTAILVPQLWKGKWIGEGTGKDPVKVIENGIEKKYYDSPLKTDPEGDSIYYQENSLLLRKEYNLQKTPAKAIVQVCGLGLYELTINGKRVGDKVLNPAKTNYIKVVLYDTYDVTSYLKSGKNAIGIMLGNGWFNPLPKWWTWRMQWFGEKRAMLQMEVTYEDGSKQVFTTDSTWKMAEGPVRRHCLYDGEIYDATKEHGGWDNPGYDDSGWENAKEVASPTGELKSQLMPPIKRVDIINPDSVTYLDNNISLVYFEQNFSGWIKIKLKASKGDSIFIRYAEDVKNGLLDTTSNRHAQARDVYIAKGIDVEIYEPRFTYHGFQYAEISGLNYQLAPGDIEGIVVHSSVKPTGTFKCSNEQINKIHKAVLWTQRSNLMGYPTDCPQRDERLGWIGDGHITAETCIYNFDMKLFYEKWVNDMRMNQEPSGDIMFIAPRPYTIPDAGRAASPVWSTGYILVTWYHYLYYGDPKILSDNYNSMKRYIGYLSSRAHNHILPKDRWGDWVSLVPEWKAGMPMLMSTAFYYYATKIVERVAHELGATEDEQYYNNLSQNIKEAFNKHYYNAVENYYEDGSQTSNTLALYFGLVPESQKEAVFNNLLDNIMVENNGHLTTGTKGTKYLMELLSREGRSDIAWKLATQTTYPSWIDLLNNRTTLAERWNWKEHGRGSLSHPHLGSVDSWFYKVLGGIQVDDRKPGFNNIIIKPYIPDSLAWVKSSVKTVKGEIRSEWERTSQKFTLKITVPVGSEATVYVLATEPGQVMENNISIPKSKNVTFLRMESDYAVFHVESGKYNFSSNIAE